MAEAPDRRSVARVVLSWHLSATVCESREVRVLDLSAGGARIQHADLLEPGIACILELPPPFERVRLTARVVWSLLGGHVTTPGSDRPLAYQSGLAFIGLTPEQQIALAATLETLESARGMQERDASR